ncbi:MAG: IreB family regulatory phosphoprotein [Clostridia bacterium]|nr:IreB family regulatory phosphoprotein [Clostridia bacterium]
MSDKIKNKMNEKTMTFSLNSEDKNVKMKKKLSHIYNSLAQKGYDPVSQIAGYIVSQDPTYITTHNDARKEAQKLDRDELLKAMIREYLSHPA